MTSTRASWPCVALATATAAGCYPPPPPTAAPSRGVEGIRAWRQARRDLAALRGRYHRSTPYTMNLALELTEPRTGQRMRARGAVAVRPPSALRMVLLGPGGTTALDLWICRDAFRFAIPAADLVHRGDASTPRAELRGLPVDFLRWWLLRPLEGHLLYHERRDDRARYVLRHDDQIVDVETTGEGDGLTVRRTAGGDAEEVEAAGPGCAPVRYRQRSTGIDIAVTCEELDPERVPPARAFADPDDTERACAAEEGR